MERIEILIRQEERVPVVAPVEAVCAKKGRRLTKVEGGTAQALEAKSICLQNGTAQPMVASTDAKDHIPPENHQADSALDKEAVTLTNFANLLDLLLLEIHLFVTMTVVEHRTMAEVEEELVEGMTKDIFPHNKTDDGVVVIDMTMIGMVGVTNLQNLHREGGGMMNKDLTEVEGVVITVHQGITDLKTLADVIATNVDHVIRVMITMTAEEVLGVATLRQWADPHSGEAVIVAQCSKISVTSLVAADGEASVIGSTGRRRWIVADLIVVDSLIAEAVVEEDAAIIMVVLIGIIFLIEKWTTENLCLVGIEDLHHLRRGVHHQDLGHGTDQAMIVMVDGVAIEEAA